MRRRRLLISVGLITTFLAAVAAGLWLMVRHVPGFYIQAEMPPSDERTALSQRAVVELSRTVDALGAHKATIDATLTADELNAYFQQDYFSHGGDDNLPDGFSAPRVRIDDGKMRIGVRYGSGLTSTVLSLTVKVWLVPKELNVVALEIVNLQAGSLPLSTGTLIDYISEAARRQYIDISWYRHEGHPVAVMRFQSHQTRPTFQFDRIELKEGRLTIAARSTDPLTSGPPPRTVPKSNP